MYILLLYQHFGQAPEVHANKDREKERERERKGCDGYILLFIHISKRARANGREEDRFSIYIIL